MANMWRVQKTSLRCPTNEIHEVFDESVIQLDLVWLKLVNSEDTWKKKLLKTGMPEWNFLYDLGGGRVHLTKTLWSSLDGFNKQASHNPQFKI